MYGGAPSGMVKGDANRFDANARNDPDGSLGIDDLVAATPAECPPAAAQPRSPRAPGQPRSGQSSSVSKYTPKFTLGFVFLASLAMHFEV